MTRLVGRFFGNAAPVAPAVPYGSIDQSAVIAEFQRRLANLEQATKLSVPADRIMSAIAMTSDAMLIAAEKIAVVGEVTFADWQRDVSGQTTGAIDPSITQIRGGVIRTEKIISFSGDAYVDLDATGTAAFIHSAGVSIAANGGFSFGGTAGGGRRLTWDGSDLRIEGNTLVGTSGTTKLVDVMADAADGADALLALAGKIDKNAAYVLGASSEFKTSGYDGGNGMNFTNNGIVARKSGVNTFVIASDGTATFAGALSAATGTFAGSLDISGAMAFKYSGTTYATAEASTGSNAYWLRAPTKNILISSGSTTVSIGGTEGTTYIRGTTQVVLSSGTKSFTITPTGYEFSDPSSLSGVSLAGHTHSLAAITASDTAYDFQYSLDGTTWTNIYLRRKDW